MSNESTDPAQHPRREPASVDKPEWVTWPDERLLDLRMCDLGVTIEGSSIQDRIDQLNEELERRNIRFRPHFWLSSEWFTPDGVGGIAAPFYLAHPRLARLEQSQMLEVEGGDPASCMRILRHEMGHAIDNAFRLRRLRRRRRVFGSSKLPYPEHYAPKPYSKSFVLHLDSWYAQSHPDEDFAETFAVWLTPDSDWRKRYAGWPAIKKLECMDSMMRRLAGREPERVSRRRVDPLHRLKKPLGSHYRRKRTHYGLESPNFYDRDLRRLFSDKPEHAQNLAAARFLLRVRRDVRRSVAAGTGTYQYTIDQVLGEMIGRCRALNLRVVGPEENTKLAFTVLLTVQTMNHLHSGGYRVAL